MVSFSVGVIQYDPELSKVVRTFIVEFEFENPVSSEYSSHVLKGFFVSDMIFRLKKIILNHGIYVKGTCTHEWFTTLRYRSLLGELGSEGKNIDFTKSFIPKNIA